MNDSTDTIDDCFHEEMGVSKDVLGVCESTDEEDSFLEYAKDEDEDDMPRGSI